MSDFSTGATDAINTILAQEANRIGKDIYSRTLHTSPWLDLTKQSAFPEGMGYQQTTLVYDRAVALNDSANGESPDTVGARWNDVSDTFSSTTLGSGQLVGGAENSAGGQNSGTEGNTSDERSFLKFTKKLKSFKLERAVIESPRLSLEDLRFAAHRQEQLRAIMDLMTQVTRNTWENRYRDEFDKVADNAVICKVAGSTFTSGLEGTASTGIDVDADDNGVDIDGNISNAVTDKVYFRLIRAGAGNNSYGRENGRPVFALVLSSEASYALQTEANFRDDVRYNNARVSELIAPLGIEKSFRGFYHLVDDLAPRYSFNGTTDKLEIVEPYTLSGGVAVPNPSYESASFEAAYVLHPEVCEALIPNPMTGGSGISFNPVNYRGKFDWKNIISEATNPDGTIGFFRGVLASATKPIKTEFGYVILFKRDAGSVSS